MLEIRNEESEFVVFVMQVCDCLFLNGNVCDWVCMYFAYFDTFKNHFL